MSRIQRLFTILRVVARYRLDELVDTQQLQPAARIALFFLPWRWVAVPSLTRGERVRKALEELGPVFIKFGQMLSTRRDMLPADLADELARLQDAVPPFAQDESIRIIETALGQTIGQLYADFEARPMASASVAQVHRASLHSGEKVVVKVVRPGIEKVIRGDIALMFTLARLIERYLPEGRRLRPVEVIADYEIVILDELDLGREAANASQLRRNFTDSTLVYVPAVFWDYSARNVLTMERITGIPVTDVETLRARGTDLKLLGERGVEIFFTQVFRDNFFHADMHPGNIFVDASDPANPSYIAVDCAIVGSLSEADQYYLARNLLAVFRQDYHEVAQLHVECGWVPPHTRVQDFEAAMRAVCEPVFQRPISEISFGQLLVYLFQTAARFDMEIQPSLVLLQKTLLNIEGLGRQLYPALDLWETAQPYLENWVQERYSPQAMFNRLQRQAPSLLEQLPQLPELLLENLNRGALPAHDFNRVQTARAQREQQQVAEKIGRRRVLATVAAIAAVLIALPGSAAQLANIPLLSWALGAAALALYCTGRR